MEIEVTCTYLQLAQPTDLNSARVDDPRIRIDQVMECPPSFGRFLYAEVGRFYHWTDRLSWTDEQIRSHYERPEVTLWVMYCEGAPAGYFELERHSDGSTEVAYFGLMQEFLGRGLGKHLLTAAVEQAWREKPSRVWLHTCTLDDAAAMPNYLKRGFKPFKQEKYVTTIAEGEELRAPQFKHGK